MPACGVVPELDPGEYGQPCFSFVFPETPVDQLTFQGSKKALSHCVIIGIPTLPIGTHAYFLASLAELNAGIFYASKAYRNLLKVDDFIGSMSRFGNCWDNAVAFGNLKRERRQWRHY